MVQIYIYVHAITFEKKKSYFKPFEGLKQYVTVSNVSVFKYTYSLRLNIYRESSSFKATPDPGSRLDQDSVEIQRET